MKFKSKKAFSLIIALGLTLLITITAIYIVEYMVPFSRNVKGIENSSKSYYGANSGIEEMVLFINKNPIGSSSGKDIGVNSTGFGFELVATGSVLPSSGEGNSDYDKDWNIIKQGQPIQLLVGNGLPNNFNEARFFFRVPNLGGITGNVITLSGGTTLPIINWQLSGSGETLNASGSYIYKDDIEDSYSSVRNSMPSWDEITNWSSIPSNISIINMNDGEEHCEGKTSLGEVKNFSDFYTDNCGSGDKCTLKFSVINKLEGTDSSFNPIEIPYLEWKLVFTTTGGATPFRFARIISTGKSYGFKKDLKARISQITGIEAFDFAVFQ